MTQIALQKQIEDLSGVKLKLKINDNRSTMLSVRWEPDITKVSMHRMFLEAPKNIMESLACYISRSDENLSIELKTFIEDGLKKLDYSHTVDKSKLYTQGEFYDLQQIYDEMNEEYFANDLKLAITWFGKQAQKNKTRLTFGLYHEQLKLIKINRLLDSQYVPKYVVDYVVYHEMVHHVCPAYIDKKGINRVHSKEFKEKEAEFKQFQLAQKWIRDNQIDFFNQIV